MNEHTVENGLPACGSCGGPAPYTITLRGEPMPACLRHLNHWRDPHSLTMEVQDEPRMFRAVCSCGRYVSEWKTTNACMGGGHRHVAAMRRTRVIPPAEKGQADA
jgi:hypothetical protein